MRKYLGRPALAGTAWLKDVVFEDGVIEVDVAAGRGRSYPAIIFRRQSEGEYEHVYLRPHRAGLYPDARPVRARVQRSRRLAALQRPRLHRPGVAAGEPVGARAPRGARHPGPGLCRGRPAAGARGGRPQARPQPGRRRPPVSARQPGAFLQFLGGRRGRASLRPAPGGGSDPRNRDGLGALAGGPGLCPRPRASFRRCGNRSHPMAAGQERRRGPGRHRALPPAGRPRRLQGVGAHRHPRRRRPDPARSPSATATMSPST